MSDEQQRYHRALLLFLKQQDLLEGYFSDKLPNRDKIIQEYVHNHIEDIIWIRILYQMGAPEIIQELEEMEQSGERSTLFLGDGKPTL